MLVFFFSSQYFVPFYDYCFSDNYRDNTEIKVKDEEVV